MVPVYYWFQRQMWKYDKNRTLVLVFVYFQVRLEFDVNWSLLYAHLKHACHMVSKLNQALICGAIYDWSMSYRWHQTGLHLACCKRSVALLINPWWVKNVGGRCAWYFFCLCISSVCLSLSLSLFLSQGFVLLALFLEVCAKNLTI